MNTREQTPRPRTKAKRRLAAAGGFAIVLFLIFVLVAYTGDPVSKHLAMNTAETYANETYPGYDIKAVAASARHWFRYEVVLESAVSEDTHFLVEVKQGRVIEDSYDETVKMAGTPGTVSSFPWGRMWTPPWRKRASPMPGLGFTMNTTWAAPARAPSPPSATRP